MASEFLYYVRHVEKGWVIDDAVTPVIYHTAIPPYTIPTDLPFTAHDKIDVLDKEFEEGELEKAGLELFQVIRDVFEDAKTMDFVIEVLCDEFYIGQIRILETGVMVSVEPDVDVKNNTRIKTLGSFLAEYVVPLTLKKAADISKGLIAGIPTSKEASMIKGDEDSETEALIDWINNNTKASIIKPKETLEDYVCGFELKEELKEIKDFFENAEVYEKAGVSTPRGVLFKGLPGTGKTYAARCVAGSVDCHFMSCTASSLQGSYIGSGAANIRDVFKGAKMLREKTDKGVIIFIDEIDSFGSRENRGGGDSGESDRTLNQMLAEMSGFEDDPGIMVMAATNFHERLDSALMRSGRFSRQITISLPEFIERKHMVEYYFNKLNMKYVGTDTDEITSLTENLTPADIKEITNESAILSIRQKLSNITLENINEAINKVITKNIRTADGKLDLKLVAAHEAGHVLMERIRFNTIPIKVTNYAYGDAGGFTQSGYKKTGLKTAEDLKSEVLVLLGGRAAEHTICGKVTTGASNDYFKASKIVRSMYKDYHFETYDPEKLDKLVIYKLQEYYKEACEIFYDSENEDILKEITDELSKKRILYARDILALTPRMLKF